MASPHDRLARPGLIKICGLRDPEHAIAAAEAGADLLGLVFASSRRQVTHDEARSIVDAVHQAMGDERPLFVGVFVDASLETIEATAAATGISVAQLHGQDVGDVLRRTSLATIRAVAPPPGQDARAVLGRIDGERVDATTPALSFIDAYDPVLHGGTGRRADWELARIVAGSTGLMLAGGLNPETVAEAIETVRPAGVDVSSGVERNGVKDPDLIRSFIARAREAFGAVPS
jgi:phosphoribosylanthranilate isomerase